MYSEIYVKFRGRYGLSNRIRAMSGYYALSKVMGIKFQYSWEFNDSCPGFPEEIFKEIACGFPVEGDIRQADDQLYIHSASQPTRCGCGPDRILDAHGKNIDTKDFYKFVRQFYDNLIPRDEIVSRVEKAWAVSGAELLPVIGVHVRRTDMVDHLQKAGHPGADDKEMKIRINKFINDHPDGKVFVASDNKFSLEELSSEFGEHIFFLNHNWIDDTTGGSLDSTKQVRLTSLFDATSDLYALSKCSQIIGSFHSSFSSFAGLWGGISVIRV